MMAESMADPKLELETALEEEACAAYDASGNEPAQKSQQQRRSSFEMAALFLLLVVCKVLWGFYLVDVRYLQLVVQPPLSALRLSFYTSVMALLATLLFFTLPRKLYAAVRDYRQRRRSGEDGEKGESSVALLQVEEPAQEPLTWAAWWHRARQVSVMAVSVGTLSFCQVYSTNFTSANFVQLIVMTTPMFTALSAHIFIQDPLPRCLIPTFIASLAGSGLVIFGASHGAGGYALTARDAIGMLLALASVLAQSIQYVWVQKTRQLLSIDATMYIQPVTICLTMPFLSLGLDKQDWGAWRMYDTMDWATLLYAGLGVQFVAVLMQQYLIRETGATIFAMGNCFRLVTAVIGSWLLLGEAITVWYAWLGIAIVLASVTYYLYVQYRDSKEGPKQDLKSEGREGVATKAAVSTWWQGCLPF